MTLTSDIDLFIYWFCQYFKICFNFCRMGKDGKWETIRCSSQGKSQGERSEGWISISIRWCGRIRNLYGKILSLPTIYKIHFFTFLCIGWLWRSFDLPGRESTYSHWNYQFWDWNQWQLLFRGIELLYQRFILQGLDWGGDESFQVL